jgi:hypothetical protein
MSSGAAVPGWRDRHVQEGQSPGEVADDDFRRRPRPRGHARQNAQRRALRGRQGRRRNAASSARPSATGTGSSSVRRVTGLVAMARGWRSRCSTRSRSAYTSGSSGSRPAGAHEWRTAEPRGGPGCMDRTSPVCVAARTLPGVVAARAQASATRRSAASTPAEWAPRRESADAPGGTPTEASTADAPSAMRCSQRQARASASWRSRSHALAGRGVKADSSIVHSVVGSGGQASRRREPTGSAA